MKRWEKQKKLKAKRGESEEPADPGIWRSCNASGKKKNGREREREKSVKRESGKVEKLESEYFSLVRLSARSRFHFL